MRTARSRAAIAMIAVSGLAVSAAGQTVSGTTVVKEGDAVDGSTVTIINAPFTDGDGKVGLVIGLEDGRRAIWYDTGVVFTSDEALPLSLTGGEGTMGVGNGGAWVYSPSIDGGDGLYSSFGVIATDDQPAADFAPGFTNTFHSRPKMAPDGTIYWVSGTNDGAGGTSTQNRILYRRTTDGTVTGLIRAGDIIDGAFVAGGSGIDFDYSFSDNNAHTLFGFNDANQASTADATVSVNGLVIAQEGSPTGQGDNWDNFDWNSINNDGNFLFSGDTDGDSASDEFVAYNGVIQLREGDAIGGGVLAGSVDGVSINNLNQAAFIWELDSGAGAAETLFYASDAASLAATTTPLLSVGDGWDDTGDGIADWTVTDFNAFSDGLNFAEDGLVYVEVDLTTLDGATTIEAVIGLAIPAPGSVAVLGLGGLAAMRRRR